MVLSLLVSWNRKNNTFLTRRCIKGEKGARERANTFSGKVVERGAVTVWLLMHVKLIQGQERCSFKRKKRKGAQTDKRIEVGQRKTRSKKRPDDVRKPGGDPALRVMNVTRGFTWLPAGQGLLHSNRNPHPCFFFAPSSLSVTSFEASHRQKTALDLSEIRVLFVPWKLRCPRKGASRLQHDLPCLHLSFSSHLLICSLLPFCIWYWAACKQAEWKDKSV